MVTRHDRYPLESAYFSYSVIHCRHPCYLVYTPGPPVLYQAMLRSMQLNSTNFPLTHVRYSRLYAETHKAVGTISQLEAFNQVN